ncbi:MAG: aldehyde dehydrogenase family protein [Acidobacteriota bacterium]
MTDVLKPEASAATEAADPAGPTETRLGIRKTYKLYVGGAFPRTESGRYDPLTLADGEVVNVSRASRKDVREAVVKARAAQGGWAHRSAYNRAQILYRIAEMLEGRRRQFEEELASIEPESDARAEVSATIDAIVYWAGWCDKFQQTFSAVNPVASSHFNFSVLEPTGVVTVVAPQRAGLFGLVQSATPAVVTGNSVLALASAESPLSAITLGEVLESSDVPPGVFNFLTGRRDELLAPLASHRDVNAIVYCGNDVEEIRVVQTEATANLKRVALRSDPLPGTFDPYWMLDTCEVKTTWHPIGT